MKMYFDGVWIQLCYLCSILSFTMSSHLGILQEYCASEIFSPSCPDGEVIIITHAAYGRMKLGRCVKKDYGILGCATDLLSLMDNRCSGLGVCDVDISDLEVIVNLPCIEDLKANLEASYVCIKVHIPAKEKCLSQQVITAGQGENILASSVSLDTNCGLHDAPWLIQAKPGQQINLTMTDFAWKNDTTAGCTVRYGYILDTETDDIINICGGTKREKSLYRSSGHTLQIVLDENAVQRFKFLIQFEVIGCPEYKAPPRSWIKEENGSLNVSCHSSEESWTIRCVENKWLGIVGECPQLPTSTVVYEDPAAPDRSKPKTLPQISRNHVISFGLSCLTLITCCLVVAIGYYCTKRYEVNCEMEKELHERASKFFSGGTMVRVRTTNRQGSTKRAQTSTVSTDLPPYSSPMPKQQRAPPVPNRMSSYRGDMSESMMSDYLAPQGGDDNSVQYYILENPTESGGKEEMYQSIHLFSSLEKGSEER